MSRKKIDTELRLKQGKRLKGLVKNKYGNNGFNNAFIIDLNDYEVVSSSTLSQIYSGKDPIESHVTSFSQVLGVSKAYLLCESPYRTDEEEKAAIIAEYKRKTAEHLNKRAVKRLEVVKNVIHMMETRGIYIAYETKEGYRIINEGDGFRAFRKDESFPISEDDFYQWIDTIGMNIRVSEEGWLHLSGVRVDSCGYYDDYSLSMDDFMKMIYDINEELTHRIESWMKYHTNRSETIWDDSFVAYGL